MTQWATERQEFGMVRSCASKVSFEHEWQAIGCCKKLAKTHGRVMRPYKCDVCQKYHTATCSPEDHAIHVRGRKPKQPLIGPHRPSGTQWRTRKYGECLLDNQTGDVLAIVYKPVQGTSLVEYWIIEEGKSWSESMEDAKKIVQSTMKKRRKARMEDGK